MRSPAWQPRVPRVPRCPKRSLLQQGQHRVHTRATGRLQRYQAVAQHLARPVQHQELPEDALHGCLPPQAECLPASYRVVSQTRPGSGCRRLTGQAGDPGGTSQRKNSNIRASTTIDHRAPPASTIPRDHRSERSMRLHQSTHTRKHKHILPFPHHAVALTYQPTRRRWGTGWIARSAGAEGDKEQGWAAVHTTHKQHIRLARERHDTRRGS